jgi:hypothetical protein
MIPDADTTPLAGALGTEIRGSTTTTASLHWGRGATVTASMWNPFGQVMRTQRYW